MKDTNEQKLSKSIEELTCELMNTNLNHEEVCDIIASWSIDYT